MNVLAGCANGFSNAAKLDGAHGRARKQWRKQKMITRADNVNVVLRHVDSLHKAERAETSTEDHDSWTVGGQEAPS